MLQSKRGERDGNDTESGDDQAGSPLHVLSDAAQKECHLEARTEAAVDGMTLSRMQASHGVNAASAAASGLGELTTVHSSCSKQACDLSLTRKLLSWVTTAIILEGWPRVWYKLVYLNSKTCLMLYLMLEP